MLDPVLNLAILVIWWWISLFVMLPIGVRSIGEEPVPAQLPQGRGEGVAAGQAHQGQAHQGEARQGPAHEGAAQQGLALRGHDLGAPVAHNLRRKALWAAVAAVLLWAATAAFIYFDPFHARPDLVR